MEVTTLERQATISILFKHSCLLILKIEVISLHISVELHYLKQHW